MKLLIALSLLVVFQVAQVRGAEAANTGLTTIPNVKLRVDSIKRINDTHVVILVKAEVEPNAPAGALLETPASKPPPNASKQDIAAGKYAATAFSLMGATMVDESNSKKYPAIVPSRSIPFFGPSSVKTSLDPGSSIQMAICFHAPPALAPDPNGVVPDQKVTLLLPNAIKPLTGLILPSDVIPKSPQSTP